MFATVVGVASIAIWIYLIAFRGGFWRMETDPVPSLPLPKRSVVAVVPARDEGAVIARSLGSLLTQDYRGPLQIVLVDDQSSDGTAAIARATAARYGATGRLTICSGQPVPHGWTGKLWAVRQGIEIARRLQPDYLLLTDADIVHGSSNLSELVARSEAGGYDLVSLMVRLNCRSLWEHLLIPAFVFFFFKLYPPRWVADPARRTSAAAGGCMLIRPAILERIGGIDRIRHEIIDDCALARRVKPYGRVWLGVSRHTRSIREYKSWRPIWDMVTRTAFAQLGYSPAMLAVTVLLLVLTYLAPPVLAVSGEPSGAALGSAASLIMAATFAPVLRAYDSRLVVALLFPLIALFYSAATVASAVLYWRGQGGYWKGRFQAPRATLRTGVR